MCRGSPQVVGGNGGQVAVGMLAMPGQKRPGPASRGNCTHRAPIFETLVAQAWPRALTPRAYPST